MPLLLILSAILTALTGVVTGARPVDVQIARQADSAAVVRAIAATKPATVGHAHMLEGFGASQPFATLSGSSAPSLAAPRLYLDRLRA